VKGGFSLRLGGSVTLYGYAIPAGIPVLAALLGDNPDDHRLVEAFARLNAAEELVLVDWRQQFSTGIGRFQWEDRGMAAMNVRSGSVANFLRADMLRHAWGFKLANDGEDTRSLQAYLGLIPESSASCSTPPSVDRDVVQWYIHAAAHAFGREVRRRSTISATILSCAG
jgi:hypothetical protein